MVSDIDLQTTFFVFRIVHLGDSGVTTAPVVYNVVPVLAHETEPAAAVLSALKDASDQQSTEESALAM